MVQSRAHSPRAESYRTLRTNLQFLNVDSSRKVFVFTSSNPNEGKTTTSLNLALALAQAGEKVVVVEGDLRKPAFADYLDIEGGAGLTDVLIGRASADDVLQRWGSDELFVAAAGRTPPNPSELLGSQTMKDTVDWLEAEFDYVIIDAPPTLAVSDAALLGSLALGVVVVVASGSTKRHELEETLESLDTSGTPILGVVATMLPLGKGTNRYYEYGYGDGGKRSAREKEKRKSDGD